MVPAATVRTTVLALYIADEDTRPWKDRFARLKPDLEVRAWPDWSPLEEVEYVLAWAPPTDSLAQCRNLKAVISLGAGVDHLLPAVAKLPDHVPVVRMTDESLVNGMTEFIVLNVLLHHRHTLRYQKQQKARRWQALPPVMAQDRRVGFMGIGNMARPAARTLCRMGFDVSAWSRSTRKIAGVKSYAGAGQLEEFLGRTDILVVVLPSTGATDRLLDKDTISRLPSGACIVNAGRGRTIVEHDLMEALDAGHIAGASLDVFCTEPLPVESPLWTHPGILVTPHVAGPTILRAAAEYTVKVIAELAAGEMPRSALDRSRNY